MLLLAVVLSLKASCPKAVLLSPVVLSSNVCLPNALFLLPENANISEGQEIIYGFRPEHVDINQSASEDAINLKVKVDQPTGSQSLVFANVGDQEICLDVPKSHLLKPGNEFKMSPQLDNIHIFDSETGKRI